VYPPAQQTSCSTERREEEKESFLSRATSFLQSQQGANKQSNLACRQQGQSTKLTFLAGSKEQTRKATFLAGIKVKQPN